MRDGCHFRSKTFCVEKIVSQNDSMRQEAFQVAAGLWKAVTLEALGQVYISGAIGMSALS